MISLFKIKSHRHLNYLQIKGQVTDICCKSQREGQFPFTKGVLFSSSVKTKFLKSDCHSWDFSKKKIYIYLTAISTKNC